MQASITDLHGQIYKRNVPLPSWSRFYLELGSFLSERSNSDTKTMVVCSVPTRLFAVSLVAVGITISRIKMGVRPEEVEEHFQKLAALPLGASMFFRVGTRSFKAKFCGITEDNGEAAILYRTQANCLNSMPKQSALNFQIALDEVFELSKRNQNGRKIPPPPPLLDLLCTDEEKGRFITQSKLDVLFIGVENRLRLEICDVPFSLPVGGETFVKGRLNDIVQLYEKDSTRQAFHSRIMSATSSNPLKGIPQDAVILFDGCLPYQRFHRTFQKNDALVVLDRTDPSYGDTVSEINKRFTLKRLVTDMPLTLPFEVPPGVEVMLWEEKRA